MAEIVLGLGVSHSPMLTIDSTEWERRSESDVANPALNLSDGRFVTYSELAEMTGEPWASVATPKAYRDAAARCQLQLDRLADELEAVSPDVVMIIGDDQGELFPLSNTPCFAIYYGQEIATNDVWGRDGKPAWMKQMAAGYAMDRIHRFPGAPALARELIVGLMDRQIDVGASSAVDDPASAGFGHAFGFIINRLFKRRCYPVLPVLVNTYFPPNVMRSGRALDVGRAIRKTLQDCPIEARVAVVASGGLSHFVVDEELDRRVIEGLEPSKQHLLGQIPPGALNSGSSEILNWIMTAGACGQLSLAWTEYEPVRRTPAGTGTGLCFACWR